MPSPVASAALAFALATVQAPDWISLRWQAANGPRDIEYLTTSVKLDAGILSVSVRRDRAIALRQDPTIAPETNPWTSMDLQVHCADATWRVVTTTAVNAEGKFARGHAGGATWISIESASMASAIRERLCPKA